MTTMKEICEKLGFNPLTDQYLPGGIGEDDNPSPLSILTFEELDFLYKEAIRQGPLK